MRDLGSESDRPLTARPRQGPEDRRGKSFLHTNLTSTAGPHDVTTVSCRNPSTDQNFSGMFLRCSQLKRRVGRGVLGGVPPETRRKTPEIPFSRDFTFPNDRCHHSFGIINQVEILRKTPQEYSTNIFGTLKGSVIVGYNSYLRSEQVLRSWSIPGVLGNSSRHRSVLFSVRSVSGGL